MNKILIMAAASAAMTFNANGADSRAVSFNDGWRFFLGDSPAGHHDSPAFTADCYDDSEWRQLSLPHDWAIEGDFSKDNPSGTSGGALPGGTGWYRKTFTLTPEQKGKHLEIDFDGVYMNSTVYLNGHELGFRPYGYASFSYDLTPYLNQNGENIIAVKVDNEKQPNSRWYSGCGIYRNVWLRESGDLRIPLWGQQLTADVTDSLAVLNVQTEVENLGKKAQRISMESMLVSPDGKEYIFRPSRQQTIKPGVTQISGRIRIPNPELWSTASPNLYTLVTTVRDQKGKVIDRYSIPYGFRYYAFDPQKGFSLNGKQMKLNGVCLHHDLGALGAAVNTRAIERQLQIMQDMGVNAIRTSHNPPAPELLDLCDRMGLLVMDETFDMWAKKKTKYDYGNYFADWHVKDMTDQFRRDRNHPSIVMWSIGNEVLEQWGNADAEGLSPEQANFILNFGHGSESLASDSTGMSFNSKLTRHLAELARELDPERPILAACHEPSPNNHLFRSNALDIIGYNYHTKEALDAPKNFPGKPFLLTETVSALATRGYYRMPSDHINIFPDRWDKAHIDTTFACSAYDNYHVPWGTTHEETLRTVDENDYIAGQFVWTGFDYIGEPTPYGWPARSSYFGIVDLAGIPKDAYYLYQSVWNPDTTVLHLFPHWNWKPGQEIDLWAYYNNADEVELFVNGESKGVKSKQPGEMHVWWRLNFEPGTVKAVSRKDGKVIAEKEIRTAGEPYAVRLTPDRKEITADGSDLSYVLVEIVDRDGNLCPWAENEVTFDVSGAGRNEGVDNGSPISMERFKADKRKAFYGKAMLIVRSDGTTGPVRVCASSPRLLTGIAEIASF